MARHVQDVGPLSGIGVSPLNENTAAEPVEADGARQVAVLIYTSGTTGTPKGVMLTHRNLLFSAKTTAALRGMTPADVQYCVLPISHIVGISLLTMTLDGRRDGSPVSRSMIRPRSPGRWPKRVSPF